MALKIDKEKLSDLSATVFSHLQEHINDRKSLERQWIKNLRQYLGKYDPEVDKLIPDERSHAYPRDTKVKVKAKVAKMMEMMFPAQEKNWMLETTEIPSIPEKDLSLIIQALEAQELVKAEQEQREPQPVSSEAIEREVQVYASQRKDLMEAEIEDQLDDPETDYPRLAKRVVRSGTIYGIGVVRSPMVRTQTERVWELDKRTGRYAAKTRTEKRPYPEYVRAWAIFPDLSAQTWREQDRIFERMVLGRRDFAALAKRPDFFKAGVEEYLRMNQQGNYTQRDYEADLRTLSHTTNMSSKGARRYEVYRHLGYITAHELSRVGIDVGEAQMHEDILADIWIIDNTVIKAEVASFGDRPSDHYPAYIAAEDEDAGLTGVGMPEDLRDSQMAICASTRAMLDNMAAVAGPIFEVNLDLLPPGRKSIGAIHAFKTIEREGDGAAANFPAVRQINTDSHIAEIQSIVDQQRSQLDMESNLPAFLFGQNNDQLGEAFRTSQNMSMMVGGANMVTKDDVRAFDIFTSELIGGFLKWNMEFNDREEIKGDFHATALGNISLVAKEVRGAALDQFVQTLTPEDRAMLDSYGILVDRLKSRDLPVDRLLPREEAQAVLQSMQQAQQQAQQIEQNLTQSQTAKNTASAQKDQASAEMIAASADATIQEILSRVEGNIGRAKTEQDRVQLENLKALLASTQETPAKGV